MGEISITNDDDAAAKKGADVDLQAEKLSHKE